MINPFLQKLGRIFRCFTIRDFALDGKLVKPGHTRFFHSIHLILFLTGIFSIYGFFPASCQGVSGFDRWLEDGIAKKIHVAYSLEDEKLGETNRIGVGDDQIEAGTEGPVQPKRKSDTAPRIVGSLLLLITLADITLIAPDAKKTADDEFDSAQQTSLGGVASLTSEEFDLHRMHWGNYKKYNRRASMLKSWVPLNRTVNAIPFLLDGLNWKSPGKTGMIRASLVKGIAFSGLGFYFHAKAKDAEDDEKAANTRDEQLDAYGRSQEANETRNMFWVNAGNDFAAAGLLWLWYDPSDGVPPLNVQVQSDGQANREVIVSFRKTF